MPLPACTCAHSSADESSSSVLLLKLRSLEKYKTNYELLCGQVTELNSQVGLQLQRHELDVATLNGALSTLRTKNKALQQALDDSNAKLDAQAALTKQDREYSDRVHRQLSTATELLKATEKRIESKEKSLVTTNQELQQRNALLDEQVSRLAQEKAQVEVEMRALTTKYAALQADADDAKREVDETRGLLTKDHKREMQDVVRELQAVRSSMRAAPR